MGMKMNNLMILNFLVNNNSNDAKIRMFGYILMGISLLGLLVVVPFAKHYIAKNGVGEEEEEYEDEE